MQKNQLIWERNVRRVQAVNIIREGNCKQRESWACVFNKEGREFCYHVISNCKRRCCGLPL